MTEATEAMEIELVAITDEEQQAVWALVVMRKLHRHGGSCACKPCTGARAVWQGELLELERLVDTYLEGDASEILSGGLYTPPAGVRSEELGRWLCAKQGCGGTGTDRCEKPEARQVGTEPCGHPTMKPGAPKCTGPCCPPPAS